MNEVRKMTSYEKAMAEVIAEYQEWLKDKKSKKVKVKDVLDNLGLKGN